MDFFEVCLAYDLSTETLRKCYTMDLMAAYREHCEIKNIKAFLNDRNMGKQMREYLRRRFKSDGIALEVQQAFFGRFYCKDSSGANEEYKRRRYYRGIWILK